MAKTKFENLLKEAKTAEEILNMQSCMTDNLTEDEVVALKAKYLGMDEKTVRNMISNLQDVKKKKWGKPLEDGMKSVVNIITA